MFDEQDALDEQIRTLNKEEAIAVRSANPPINPWLVVFAQLVVTLVAALLGLVLTRQWSVAYSLVWGGLCVVVPSAVFARGLMSKASLINPATAAAGFFVWEFVKIGLVVAMLLVSKQLFHALGQDLHWFAMLVGLIVTMKVYLLALLCKPKVRLEKNN